ncbi:het domain containing protein [Drepanopeziza brunnea f. sp. 'multigermtubi' MB_m1]|uniref:Het domain containing protein n=1 Tax=Marssonina brunnea f. sp. multigermtubi (strain MB_m1) TaxID=1072389 RepID=K1XYR2_MARBU|nr:het domain containing protein [Drepanopeziza brunnea f. sp. 'multigermtubi' MB_m1]EKD17979.1 het domain containing protein [Drepanopeziza brunnea f. sp. 'multigermtubi' MB_m1]
MRGPDLDRMQVHQPSYLALRNAASAGCQLFFEGRSTLERVSEQYPGRQISLVAWGRESDGWLDRILVTTTGEIPDGDSDQEESGAISDPTMHPDYQLALSGVLNIFAYPGRPLPLTAGDSDEDFELVRRWLEDCRYSHESCRKASLTHTRLPTRVLDIGAGDGLEEPYLLETSGMHGCYITLSHCWGGEVPLTTTSATIIQRKLSIPLSSLPKTFRDAVFISRRLDVRYLWVDSLCIVQDSRSDWEKESALMGDVYGRSYLTIAARGAANANVGCFIPRNAELPPCRLEYRDGPVPGAFFVRDPSSKNERIDQSPLDGRGWVFQERILSPRVLYYGSQQLYWECASATLRQDGKYRDVEGDKFRSYDGFKQCWDPNAAIKPRLPPLGSSEYPVEMDDASAKSLELMSRWYRIVEQYSRRQLTFASDRLPAIAGVAKQFHRSTGYAYVAGLWKEDLVAGLLWYRSGHKGAITSSRLPTWSWARFSGGIGFWGEGGSGLKLLKTDCYVLDLSYEIMDRLGNYGEVSNARLLVEGRVVRVRVQPGPRGEYEDLQLHTADGVPVGRPKFDEMKYRKLGSEYYCLQVHKGYRSTAGLLLEELDGQRGEYGRVGYVTILSTERPISGYPDGRLAFSDTIPQVLTIV